jgi:plasminogen activator
MKPKIMIGKISGIFAAATLLFAWTDGASAAGPVSVSPGPGSKVVTESSSSLMSFSVDLGAGYLTGESKEAVFLPNVGNHKVSELTWEIDNLFMVGVGATLKAQDWVAINFSGWFKAFDGDGTLDDYDFLIPGQDWTDWSHHEDTDVTDGSIIDINVELSFFRTDTVAFKALAGYKRDNFGWEASGGDFIYSEGGFRNTTGSFPAGVQVISYEQTFTSLYFGLGLAAKFNDFGLGSRFIYSPLVQGEATDHHFSRNLVTSDDGEDGDLIGFDVTGSYLITPRLAVEMGYSYQRYDMMQGDSTWNFQDEGVVIFFPNGAGMEQTSSLFSAMLRYTF